MRAVDTNVLVRYIVNDDLKQAEAVDQFFEECRTRGEPVFIPGLVLCELVWVLARTYQQTKSQVIGTLEKLLEVDLFRFDQESAIRQALEWYRRGKASFPDYVIGEISRQAGCRSTDSFDADLRGAAGFTALI